MSPLLAWHLCSITAGVPTTAVPLCVVLFFDAVVTGLEDYRRHKDDNLNNKYEFQVTSCPQLAWLCACNACVNTSRPSLCSRPTRVMNDGGSFRNVPWKDVHVGDIIKVQRGEKFPADLVFLRAFTEVRPSPSHTLCLSPLAPLLLGPPAAPVPGSPRRCR